MRWWREQVNQLGGVVLDCAVGGDSRRWTVRFLRRLLRVHPTLYMTYCYRSGWLREVVRINAGKTVRGDVLRRVVRRSKEMCQVLDGKLTLVNENVIEYRTQHTSRVLLVFHSAASFDPAGYTVRSSALMRALARENVSFVACTRYGYPWDLANHRNKSPCTRSMAEGFMVHHFPDPKELIGDRDSRYLEEYSKQLCEFAAREQASVIHAASSFLNGLAAIKAARRLGIGSVYEMRGLWHVSRCVTEPEFRYTDHFAYCEAMELEAARRCDRVVAISGALRDWLVGHGVEADKIHVIPNAAEPGKLSEAETTEANADGVDGGGVTVGFIGSLTRYEGVDLIIEAVARLVSRFPGLQFVVVGDGRERSALESLSRRLKCAAHVKFVGRVPKQRVVQYYRAIDIFPLPRRRFEVCELIPPLKPLEIMAHERSLIVSDVAPLAELVTHEQTGLVCSADDLASLTEAIGRLCEDSELRNRIARNGCMWVETERNWAQNGRLYSGLYSQMTGMSGSVNAGGDTRHG